MKHNSKLGIIARGWNPKEPSNKTNFLLLKNLIHVENFQKSLKFRVLYVN